MSDDPVRDGLKMMSYGFYSVTSRSGGDMNAMVVNWLTQVSFEPRLMALGLQKTSYTHGLVDASGVLAINIFKKEDADLIKPFTKSRAKNPEKMAEARFSPAPVTGCPVLEGAAAYLECEVVAMYDAGDQYSIVVAEVVGGAVYKPGDAGDTLTLPYLGWSYAG